MTATSKSKTRHRVLSRDLKLLIPFLLSLNTSAPMIPNRHSSRCHPGQIMTPHYVRGQLCHRLECSRSSVEKLIGDRLVEPTRWRPNFARIVVDRPTWSATASPLFRLPLELLERIVQDQSSIDLCNFALTNRDCHALARAYQFRTVHLDLADEKPSNHKPEDDEVDEGLLSHLLSEVQDVGEIILTPHIAPYIRCLSITAGFGSGSGRTVVPEELCDIIPKLESLRSLHHNGMTAPGGRKTEMTPKYLLALSNSKIERLQLERFTYRPDLDYSHLQSFLSKPWRLQALVLNLIDSDHWADPSQEIFWHILRACGHLKHLSSDIYPQLSSDPDSGFDEFSESTYPFLKTLHLAETIVDDEGAYFPPMDSLTALSIDGLCDWYEHLMTQSLPTVSSFAMQVDHAFPELFLNFLTINPQLRILSLQMQSDTAPRDNAFWAAFIRKLPRALRHLSRLEALKFDPNDDEFTKTILLALSKIHTLKRLSLGHHGFWSTSSKLRTWPAEMCFSSLECLELEISSYGYKPDVPQHQQVSSSHGTPHERALELQYTVQQAKHWARHHPKLKWLALEGYAFSFDEGRQPRCLNYSEAKDDYFNELEGVFTIARPWI